MKTSIETERKIIDLYLNGVSSTKIAKIIGLHSSTVLDILIKNKIRRRKTGTRYICNENFFEKIDTEEKAYWYGFIVSDGNIKKNKLKIGVSEKDKNHLFKFKRSINGTHPVHTYTKKTNFGQFNISEITICSSKVIKNLKSLGLIENKSTKEKFLVLKIEQNLLKSFWRGMIDGDGWISIYQQNYKEKRYNCLEVGLCGSLEIITSFVRYIKNNLEIELKIKKDGKIFKIQTNGKKAIKILEFLYLNSNIFLDRKMESVRKAFEIYEQRYCSKNQ